MGWVYSCSSSIVSLAQVSVSFAVAEALTKVQLQPSMSSDSFVESELGLVLS